MKSLKTSRLLLLSGICSSMVFVGCTNDDYDMDNVDYTLGFGSGTLTLPSNNSVKITLDDILDLGSTDLITTDANGDYRFGKDPESVAGVTVTVDPITLDNEKWERYDFTFNLPDEVMLLPVSDIDCSTLPSAVQEALTPAMDIQKMDYSFDLPGEVESLDYVAVGGDRGVTLRLNLTMPTLITASEVTLDLPSAASTPATTCCGAT